MEGIGGVSFIFRKKRSCVSRQRISDSSKFSKSCAFLVQSKLHLGSGCNEGAHNFKETTLSSSGLRGENKLKKLKLKLGGVTHTLHTKYASESFCSYHIAQPKEKSPLEDSAFGDENSARGKYHSESVLGNEAFKHESVRKSRRVPKRRELDIRIDEDDDIDEEIRYLEGLKYSKERAAKFRFYEDEEYIEGEEPLLDDEPAYKNNRRGSTSFDGNGRSKTGASIIEFPLGLPFMPKKQKAKLSEVEQQVKKAEAAQKRRIQSEKAAKEAEAEAIRKILCQDSARKKKEDKMKKLHNQLAQEKSANLTTLGSNTVRWVFGPTGTAVIFSNDIGLPSIFNSLPCSYPPPREKCAGPNCTNAYKYRDSKSKLPLCSLHCYKAIHEKMHAVMTC